MNWQTLKVRFEAPVCYVQLYRPEANNTINALLIEECINVLEQCEKEITIVIFEGLPEVFCFGADFQGINKQKSADKPSAENPERTFHLWEKMATGPYITIAHVRGRANAGGIGFVSACDIVIADTSAQFSLSEMLWGLFPAVVLPFLIRRIGHQKANYMTMLTKPFSVEQAHNFGLVDDYGENSEQLLKQHLSRVVKLPKNGIGRYKQYMMELSGLLQNSQALAVAANREIFANPENLQRIYRFVESGVYPWEQTT